MINRSTKNLALLVALFFPAMPGLSSPRLRCDLQYGQIAGHRVLTTYSTGTSPLIHPYVNVIFQDWAGRYWIGTDTGLNLYDEKRKLWTSFTSKGGELGDDGIRIIAQSNDHRVWFASGPLSSFYGFGVACFDGHQWRKVDASNSTLRYFNTDGRPLPVYTMFAGPDGKLWFGVEDALVSFDGRTWTPPIKLSKATNQPTPITIEIGIQDSEGDVWLAGALQGIIRFDERRVKWTTYNPMVKNTSLFGDDFDDFRKIQATSVRSIFEDRTGRIWFGAANGYVYVYDKRRDFWKSLKLLEYLPSAPEPSLSLTPGSPSLTIWSIYEDKAGKMMFATDRGLLVYVEERDQAELYTSKNSCLPSDTIYTIMEDRIGRIWLGTKGLIVLK